MATKTDKLILVTGATGHQGGAAVRQLRKAGFRVRAMTRDAQSEAARALSEHGTEIVQGDLNDQSSLRQLVDAVDGVFSVQAMSKDGQKERQQGKDLIDAANRAGISHFVYSSVWGADKNSGVPHFESKFEIEEHLRSSGLSYTILRPVSFMENFLPLRDPAAGTTLSLPMSAEAPLQTVALDDIGVFVVRAFEKPGKWNKAAIELAGDTLTMTQTAEALSAAFNHEIQYQQVPWDQFEKAAGQDLTLMYRYFEKGENPIDVAALRREYSGLHTFQAWLNTNRQAAGV